MDRCDDVLEECPSCEVDAKNLRELVDHNNQPDAGSETNEYWL